VTRRRRPRFNLGNSPLQGGSFSPRPSGGSPTARRLPRPAPPVTGRRGPRRIPLPRPPAPRPGSSALRQMRQKPGTCHGTGTGTPRIVRAGPSSVKGAPSGRVNSLRSPLTLEPLPAQRPANTGQAEGPARLARGEPLSCQESVDSESRRLACRIRATANGPRRSPAVFDGHPAAAGRTGAR
jgi:hypothetical protein